MRITVDRNITHVQKVGIFLLLLISVGIMPLPSKAASNSTAPFPRIDLPVAPNPEAARATCGLGQVALMGGQLDEAIANYSECIKYDPTLIDGYLLRGETYLEKAKTLANKSDQAVMKRQAVEDFGKAIALGYNEPDIFRTRGETLAEIGETQLAIRELRQAAQQYKLKGLDGEYNSILDEIKQLEKQLE